MEKYRRITRKDRYQIQKYLALGKSKRWISNALGFHRATIYREIERGKNLKGTPGKSRRGDYNGWEAHRKYIDRNYERRGYAYKGFKIKGWIEDQIRMKLSEGWSPEQISNRLKMEKSISISTEGIYKYILSCKRRGEELHKYLRRYRRCQRRFKRRNRYWEMQYQRRKSIEQRPLAANQRTEAGHWERDLMLGKRKTGAVLAAVDRKTHYTILAKLKTTFANETNKVTAKVLKSSRLPVKTITNDNGHEFGEFWNLENEIKVPIYFTHALCPWERGTVENTIGLLRQFIPKGSELNKLSDDDILEVQSAINSRPRKQLGFKTPMEIVTGKPQKLIKQKRIEPLPPEHYEKYYLTTEEIEKKNNFREKFVALTG